MPYRDQSAGFDIYIYGEAGAPAGAGKGEQLFPTIVNAARASGKKFEDPHFLADASVLGGIGSNQVTKWLRPGEIAKFMFPNNPTPFLHGSFDEFAVAQGVVGDCWLLSVLADIATKPEVINTVVPPDNLTVGFDSGAFHFRFWCRGKWIDVVIDDRLPCWMIPSSPNLFWTAVFTKPSEKGGFWAPLVEKAYAKLFGTYKAIDMGYAQDAMIDFTGGLHHHYEGSDPKLKAIIQLAVRQNALLSMSTKRTVADVPNAVATPYNPSDPGAENVTTEGMVLTHVYSILDIQDVQNKIDTTQQYTLIKCRNPWGNEREWNGAFCDTDPKGIWPNVTPDLRRVSTERTRDGEFWMPMYDFTRYCQNIDTCRWSARIRGDANFTENGVTGFFHHGCFTTINSGPQPKDSADMKTRSGFFIKLTPAPVDASAAVFPDELIGKVINGRTFNCSVNINIMWLNYTKATLDDSIPIYGYRYFWSSAPPETFFDKIDFSCIEFYGYKRSLARRTVTSEFYLPAGTLYILPWIDVAPVSTNIPYLLRIIAEGTGVVTKS